MPFINYWVRRTIAAISIIGSIGAVVFIFWKHEIKYAKPTPVPQDYSAIETGQNLHLPQVFTKGSAYFLHFYSPDCPCSRFNARHIKSLISSHNDSIQFVIIVPAASDLDNARAEFGEDLHYVSDPDQQIAKACGVYSTPQAVIVTQAHTLFYRGNYNSARYCTTRASNFAELSLIAFLNHQPSPMFGLAATQSYGCELQQAGVEFF